MRHRCEEIRPGILYEGFDLAFVVSLPRAAKPLLKEVMANKLREGEGSLALASLRMRATAILRLSYKIDSGTPPKKAKSRCARQEKLPSPPPDRP
jgi:hypothetical protein